MHWTRYLMLATAVALVAPTGARADKDKAMELFKKGTAQYKLERYDDAIADFSAAYQEEQSPVLLFNIAQSHRLAGRPRLALNFYRKYLRDMPEAVNRAQVEQEMAHLEVEVTRLDAEEAAARELQARRAQQAIQQPTPARADKPRWPLWLGIGVGAAVVVGGAVVLGVVLSEPKVPSLGLESAR